MKRQARIKEKLSVLKPHFCEIINESYKHAGHKHAGIETHFKIKIAADIFQNKNLLASHRKINDLLKPEFENGLHALSIEIL